MAVVGNQHGFVEMLQDSTPVDEIDESESSRANNGWRASNTIYPSAVATFIGAYVLNIRDRHKGNSTRDLFSQSPACIYPLLLINRHTGNMVVTGGVRLANIDFGWLEEGPKIDTG